MTAQLAFYSTPDPYADDGVPFFKSQERPLAGRLQLVPDEPEPEPDESWQERALCAQVDPELFFPEQGTNNTDDALAVCRTCPVLRECRADALTFMPAYGIQGGLSDADRRAIRRKFKRHNRARKTAGRTLRTTRRPPRERTRESA